MRGLLTVAARELGGMFRLPVGWVVIALFSFVSAIMFNVFTLRPGEPADLRAFFEWSAIALLVVAPAITMRLFSEELRAGTIESLMTAPVTDWALVLGKFFGAVGFLLAIFLPTASFVVILALLADRPLDPGPIGAGYLSLTLTGMAYLALGTLVSALTASQTLAFLGTFLALIVLLLGPILGAPTLPDPYAGWLLSISFTQRVEDFAKGVVDSAHILFFLSVSLWLLAMAYLALGSRRWR
ncbi:MAG: ABC transporter permease subunit [Phycisphaerales bacterium JB037]